VGISVDTYIQTLQIVTHPIIININNTAKHSIHKNMARSKRQKVRRLNVGLHDHLHTYIMIKRVNQQRRGLPLYQISELKNFFSDEERTVRAFDDVAVQVCIRNSNVWKRQFESFKKAPGGGKSKYPMLPRGWDPSDHFYIKDDVPHDRYTPLTSDEYQSQFYEGDDSTYDVGNGSNGDEDSAAATAASGDNVRVGRGDERGDSVATDVVKRGYPVGNGSGGDGDSAAAASAATSGDNVRVGRGDGREDSVVNGSGGRGRSDADAPAVSDENVQVGREDSVANAGEGGASVGNALNPICIDSDNDSVRVDHRLNDGIDHRLYDDDINLDDYNGLLERFGTGTEAQRREVSAERIAAIGSTAYIDRTCTICLCDFNGTGRMLPCGHIFHHECIKTSLETKLECPICREKFY